MPKISPLFYLTRPARVQAEKKVETHTAHELDYNIWLTFLIIILKTYNKFFYKRYHKHLGEEKEVEKFVNRKKMFLFVIVILID